MHRRLAVLLFLLAARAAEPITWDFAEGIQGWHARDGQCALGGVCPPLRSMAADGVWGVTPVFDANLVPFIELVSPELGHPAELFDRLDIRLRVVHPRPLVGQLGLYWVSACPDENDGSEWRSQLYEPPTVFTGEWQTLTVTSIAEHEMTVPDAWDGVLREIRIRLLLSDIPSQSAADVPEIVEIDQIRLTGTEEQLSGELPPPDPEAAYYGTYLSPSTFYLLSRGVGESWNSPGSGALADMDGDGDLDVLTGRAESAGGGWMYALNDGAGQFGSPRLEMLGIGGRSGPDRVAATDLNGDGRVDVVVMDTYSTAQVLYSDGAGAWEEGDFLPAYHKYLGAGDMEGDGDEDLWFLEGEPEPLALLVLVAGEGPDLRRERVVMQPESMDPTLTPSPACLVGNLSGAPTTSVLIYPARYLWSADPNRTSDHAQFTGYHVMRWERGGFAQTPCAIGAHPGLTQSIGDFDRDGDLDFVLANELLLYGGSFMMQVRGLVYARGEADGSFTYLPWVDAPVLSFGAHSIKWADLDGDGALDAVFADHASHGPALMVCVGQTDGSVPIVEGRYELDGLPEEALVGDIDNDGDQDVLVIESTHGQDGGVEVFLNLAANRSTAVCDRAHDALPAAPCLGPCYPNPFNAGTVIPVTVPAGTGTVRLVIYNGLGQRVRTLVDGNVSPGVHAIRWDGCDSQGASAGSGTYLCRLEAAGQEQSLRLTKLE